MADSKLTASKGTQAAGNSARGATTPEPLQSDANPEGKENVSTGPVGDAQVIDAQEHVLGDDPRRVKAQMEGGFHDSLSGRAVDADGNFTDRKEDGAGPIPKHRIVANDWPGEREKLDDPALREGNKAQ